MDNIIDSRKLRELIRLFERKLGTLADIQTSCCEVTMAQCHALVEIGRANGMALNELAQLLNLDNSTTSRTVNNLVNSGLATRDTHPQDRRYVTIVLTEEGRNIYNGIEERMNKYYKKIYDLIPADKKGQVLESLELLLELLDDDSYKN